MPLCAHRLRDRAGGVLHHGGPDGDRAGHNQRPETIECGSNVLSGTDPDAIRRCLRLMVEESRSWQPPPEYLIEVVSGTVMNVLL